MDLEVATNFDGIASEEIKWSDNIAVTEIYSSKKIKKEVSRKELLKSIASHDKITKEFILLLKSITFKKLAINFYFPNFLGKTKVELVLGEDRVSFIPSEEFKEMLQNL